MFFPTTLDRIFHQVASKNDLHPCLRLPPSVSYPLTVVYDNIYVKLWKQKKCIDWQELAKNYRMFVNSSYHNAKEQLDPIYLIESFKRSDYVVFALGKPMHIVDANDEKYLIEEEEQMLGFATMHCINMQDFLIANPMLHLPSLSQLYVSKNPKSIKRVLMLETIGSRYKLGRLLMNTVEKDVTAISGCDMVALRAMERRLAFFVKRGFVRSNNWQFIFPLHEAQPCRRMWYIYVENMDTKVSYEILFKGDGNEMGYLVTKYVGKDRYELRQNIVKFQEKNRCMCLNFLGI